jgi:2-amino-4-hydroxy-6-hydroxymethyldihydropteridine diphosphokinase
MTEKIYIGLGSNLGNRERSLLGALQSLGLIDAAALLQHSSLYESVPVGPPQPRYLNAVVEMECALQPQQLLTILKQIEIDLGRQKSGRWAPRAIDLDILLWGERLVAEMDLQIPHLELHKRRFALEPLCELNAKAIHPVLGRPVCDLLRDVQEQEVVKLSSEEWRSATCGSEL